MDTLFSPFQEIDMPNRRLEAYFRFAEQHELLDRDDIKPLLQIASITDNPTIEDAVEKFLGCKALQQRAYPFSATSGGNDGITLGDQLHGGSFSIDPEMLSKHLLAIGQSGAGKTTLLYRLFDELDTPIWCFDLKQDYRHLTRTHESLLVLPWTEFRFNPLKPPTGVAPRRWIHVLAEIFGHATALLSGSKNHLLKKLVELYQLYDLFDRVEPPFPSLHELELVVRNEPINYVRRQSNYRDTLLNRLEAINMTAGTVFNCSEGYGVSQLLNRDVIFEFDGLSRDVQNFLMEILFASVYEYRVANNERDQGLDHVFFLDEGKRVFSVYKERQEAAGIPEIDELTAKMREFGEGLIVADQEATKLTDSIKANTYTKILLPTGDMKQFNAVAESMQLSDQQRNFAHQLEIGEAIIQVGHDDPVPIKIAEYPVTKNVTDATLLNHQRTKWDDLQYSTRETPPELQPVLTGDSTRVTGSDDHDDNPDSDVNISDAAERLLRDIVDCPFRPLTERYDEFSSRYKGHNAKSQLVEVGFVVERTVRPMPVRRKLLQLTERGREYVETALELDASQRGRGGIVHQFWQQTLAETIEDGGWEAKLEESDADVYATKGSQVIAIEIAMKDTPREIDHIKDHLNDGYTVMVFCRTEAVRDGVQRRLQEHEFPPTSIEIRLLRDVSDPEHSLHSYFDDFRDPE